MNCKSGQVKILPSIKNVELCEHRPFGLAFCDQNGFVSARLIENYVFIIFHPGDLSKVKKAASTWLI